MKKKNNECEIHMAENGLEINGKCSQGLSEILNESYKLSKKSNSELFAITCIDSKTGEVEKALLGNSGSSKEVKVIGVGRICPKNMLQVSHHTHPVSEKAKFSPADGVAIVDRFNLGYDDIHCVMGKNEPYCISQTRLERPVKKF